MEEAGGVKDEPAKNVLVLAEEQERTRGCVCVCHPLFLRVLRSTHFNPAGACDTLILSHATKLWIRVGRETSPVSCTCDVNS